MSYQVIARKWRPKVFAELIGQPHISQTLLNALKNNRLPHALLFTGPRGTGKTSSARILAKALRCPQSQDFSPCGTCEDCLDIASGRSVNVVEIDGASNNGVDAIRELRDTVSYMPSTGRYKIYIIDEVHMLSTSAFNALLKTLEEPPPHVVFIIATTEAHKIPNTILSRCQRFDFRRIPLKLVSEALSNICEADGVQAEADALWMIARQGEGSMRDAQSLLDQVITFSNKTITLEKVINVLGLTDRSLLTKTIQALVKKDKSLTLKLVEEIFNSGMDCKVYVNELIEELRNFLLVKLSQGQSQIVDLPESEIETLMALAADVSEEDIHLLFDMALKGGNDLAYASDPKIVLEMLLLRMTSAPKVIDIQKMLAGQITLMPPTTVTKSMAKTQSPPPAKEISSAPPIQTQKTESSTEKPPSPHLESMSVAESPTPPAGSEKSETITPAESPQELPAADKWGDLVLRIKKVNGLLAAKLEHSYIKELEGEKMVVAIPPKMKFLFAQASDPNFIKKLENYVNTFWGKRFKIDIELGSEEKKNPHLTPKQIEKQKKEDHNTKIREEVMNHPLIKEAHSHFKFEIQSIKEMS